VGRYDALNGLIMKGDGKGGFVPQSIVESGVFIPGNGKALVKIRYTNGGYMMAASQNRGPLKLFGLRVVSQTIPIANNEIEAIIEYQDGTKRKEEFYYGQSFLSQSGRFLLKNDKVKSITIIDIKGNKRII
jgi:hypothetical protein